MQTQVGLPTSTRLRIIAVLAGGLIALGGVIAIPNQAVAVQSFNNAAIADAGLAEVGTSRPTGWNQPGECIKSVQRWVAAAGGYFGGGGVISGYVNSGAEEVSLSSAVKGDVIQYTNGNGADQDWSYVHTVVVINNHGNGTFDIVQSNSPPGSGLVTRVNNWTPSPASGWVSRVWRFGEVQTAPQDSDADGIPDSDDDCPSQPGPASTSGCPDADGDGVRDSSDECPDDKGPSVNRGCPIKVISGSQDFNGNGRADILWYGPGSRHDALWYGHTSRSAQFNKEHSITVVGVYTPVSGDFDGDGYGDIFWYRPGSGSDTIWYGTDNGGQFDIAATDVVGAYVPVTGDFNGDNHTDIIWYGSGSYHDAIWYGHADRVTQFDKTYAISIVGAAYTSISGDFDGDGYGDVLWYRPGSAGDTLWYGTGNGGQFDIVSTAIDGTYIPIVGDFNGNGRDDILLYGLGGKHDAIWYGHASRSAQFNKSLSIEVKGTYIPASGDFDGDGYTDIFWYGPGSAHDALWYGTSVGAEFVYADSDVVGWYTPISAG